MIRPLAPAEASDTCVRLTGRLTDWFGIPSANVAYVNGVAECHCLGALDRDGTCVGMIALRAHFGTTVEIWWMAVDPQWHRQGIGASLTAAAEDHARKGGFRDMVLMTLSDDSDDPGYTATRAFYAAQGFRPLMRDHIGDPDTPLMWMIRSVAGPA